MDDKAAIGKALRRRRLVAGWTQQQAAERCGVVKRVYQYWEYGNFEPSGRKAREVERVFRASIKTLIKEGNGIKD